VGLWFKPGGSVPSGPVIAWWVAAVAAAAAAYARDQYQVHEYGFSRCVRTWCGPLVYCRTKSAAFPWNQSIASNGACAGSYVPMHVINSCPKAPNPPPPPPPTPPAPPPPPPPNPCSTFYGYDAKASFDVPGDNGNDIDGKASASEQAAFEACSADPSCQAFNSKGWRKKSLDGMGPKTWATNWCLYVKRGVLMVLGGKVSA